MECPNLTGLYARIAELEAELRKPVIQFHDDGSVHVRGHTDVIQSLVVRHAGAVARALAAEAECARLRAENAELAAIKAPAATSIEERGRLNARIAALEAEVAHLRGVLGSVEREMILGKPRAPE